MAFEKECGPCGGEGYIGLRTDICRGCAGLGEISLDGDPTDYKKCGPCGGDGYVGLRTATCSACKGTGLLRRLSRPVPSVAASRPTTQPHGTSQEPIVAGKVFIVHGRNHAVRDKIDLFLTKELGLSVQILEAGAHQGRALPEKFEELATSCTFAVFIFTADDELWTVDDKKVLRARQNVVLETGYFWGALGRRGRVAFLVEHRPEIELPSDLQGLGWIPITEDLGETKLRLRKELVAAGLAKV